MTNETSDEATQLARYRLQDKRRHHAAQIAGLTARGARSDDPRVVAARQNLQEAGLTEAIAEVVAASPQLRPEQRERLATLLLGDLADESGAAAAS